MSETKHNVKPVVIDKLVKSITTGFYLDEKEWLQKYKELCSLDKEAMISRFMNNINKEMEKMILEKQPIYFPSLGTFEIKEARLKASEFTKQILEVYDTDDINTLQRKDVEQVVKLVRTKMQNYKNDKRKEKQQPFTIRLIKK